MNILEQLKKRNEKSYQALADTKSGNLYLSVVAGEHLYSEPREFMPSSSDYSEVELAIFNKKTNEWASWNEVKDIFPIIGNGEYTDVNYSDDTPKDLDASQCAVFGYVDINLINQVWELL